MAPRLALFTPSLLVLLACARAAAQPPLPCFAPSAAPAFNASAFSDWIVASAAAGARALCVAPGAYTLAAPAPGVRAHLVLPAGLQGPLALSLAGVELTCESRHAGGLYAAGWQGVELAGLTLRYALPPSNTAAIVAVNASAGTVDVAVEAGHPLEDWAAGTVRDCNLFDSAHRLRVPLTFDLSLSNVSALPSARLFRAAVRPLAGIAPGQLLGCRVAGGAMTVLLDNATGVTLRDVALYGGPGFGFFEVGGSGNSYVNISIRLPPPPPGGTTQPLLSTSADGLHSAGARVGPRITGASFTGMDDDGIAVHGGFMLVTDADAPSGRVWVVAHSPLLPGDALRLYSPAFTPLPAPQPPVFAPVDFVIEAVERAPPGYVPPFNTSRTMPSQTLPASEGYAIVSLRGAAALPPGLGFDYVASNANAVGSGFLIQGCSISNHRARGMLLKGSHGQVLDNNITNSSLGGIIVTPELYWREASYAQNLTLACNRVTLTSSGAQSYGGIALGAVAPGNVLVAGGAGHSAVTIENNTLTDCGYMPIWLNAAAGVRLLGNRLNAPFRLGPGGALPQCCEPLPYAQAVAVYAEGVSALQVAGNCVAPAPPGLSGLRALLNVSECSGQWEGGVVMCES
jgi:hypothetical protein